MLRKLFTFFSMVTILNTILVDAQSVAKMPVTKKQVVAKKRGNHHSMLAPNHSRAIAGDEPHQEPVQQHPQVTMPHSQTNVQRAAANITQIGTTTYDLQTNNSTFRRVVNLPGGDIAAMWTFSDDGACGYNDRGTGFNRYNAATGTWGSYPTTRLEGGVSTGSLRTGFGGMGRTENGRLFVISHSGGIGLKLMYTDNGTNWTQNNFTDAGTPNEDPCALWPRFAVSGNTIHVVASRQADPAECDYALNGLLRGLNYFRSTDAGETWEGPMSIPGLDEDNFTVIGGDVYAMDARGNTVALVVSGRLQPTLFKSLDGGQTWSKTIIQPISDPLYYQLESDLTTLVPTTLLDRVATCDDAFDVLIDNDGKVNVWYGRTLIQDEDEEAGASIYPTNTSIMYWNEDMGTGNVDVIGETVRQDYDGDGEATYDFNGTENGYFSETVSMPSAAMDAEGNLYLVYSSIIENDLDANGNNYRGVFAVKSTDGGNTWQGPVLIDGGNGVEAVYPMISRTVDGNIYLVYMKDNLAGTSLQPTATPLNPCHTSQIMFATLPTNEIVSPNTAGTNPPDLLLLSVPYGLEGCPYYADGIENYTLDYPDGLLDFTLQNASFDLENPTPNDLSSYDLVFTDSDGNSLTESIDSLVIFEDTEAPIFFPGPYAYLFNTDTDDPTDTVLFSLFGLGFADTIDIVQNTTYTDAGTEVYDLLTFPDGVKIDVVEAWNCPLTLITDNSVDTTTLGTYYVTYSATDGKGNNSTLTRVVRVIGADVDAPVIYVEDANGNSIANGEEFNLNTSNDAYLMPEYLVFDNVDGNLTANTTVSGTVDLGTPGTYTVTYTATDAAGNQSTFTFTVIVADTQAPTMTFNAPAILSYGYGGPSSQPCGTPFVDPPGIYAYDAVDGVLTSSIVVTGTVNTSCGGTYYLTYTVSDAAGNVATLTRTINVSPTCTSPDCPVGLNNVEVLNGVSIYPNPVQGIVNIAVPNVSGKVTVTIYNAAGAVVRNIEQNLNKGGVISADLSNVAAGTYVATITAAEGTATQRFVVGK